MHCGFTVYFSLKLMNIELWKVLTKLVIHVRKPAQGLHGAEINIDLHNNG